AKPICFKLFLHCVLRAASLACCTAGNSSAIKIAMIAITTNSSIKVNARNRRARLEDLSAGIMSLHAKGKIEVSKTDSGRSALTERLKRASTRNEVGLIRNATRIQAGTEGTQTKKSPERLFPGT